MYSGADESGESLPDNKEREEVQFLIAREIPQLRRFARVLARDAADADDLVQDTLEKALRKWTRWRRQGSVRSWLFTIQYRLFLDRHRSNARKMEAGLATDIDSEGPATAETITRPAQEQQLMLKHVLAALRVIPAEQRTVLALVSLEGLSYDEVATIMMTPVGTVRSRLYRAREALREYCLYDEAEQDISDAHARPASLRVVK